MNEWLIFNVTVEPWSRLHIKAFAVLCVLFQLLALVFLLTIAVKLAWGLW